MSTDKTENRLVNGRNLLLSFDSKKEFAEACELAQSQVGQIFGDNAHVVCGNTIARRIEKACKKPPYWMDSDHTNAPDSSAIAAMELQIEVTLAVNEALLGFDVPPHTVKEEIYRKLLWHIGTVAQSSGRVVQTQVESAVSLSGLVKGAR